MLDTNVCIGYLRVKNTRLLEEFRMHQPEDLVVCAPVRSELVYGALRSADASKSHAAVMAFIAPLSRLAFDDASADAAARIRSELAAAGSMIGPYDLQIAAIAIVNALVLVTHNTREFARVGGLLIEDWERE